MVDLSVLAPIGFAKATAAGVYEIPFLDRMFIVFFVVTAGMVLISKLAPAAAGQQRGLEIDRSMFRVDRGFAIGTAIIGAVLIAVYALWW
jgi:SSS family solute:Na+ symporter